MTKHVDPERGAMSRFLKLADAGPIWMLNLIRLRKNARYEDGRAVTGREAYATYGRESEPFFKSVGGKIIWSATPEFTLIGPEDESWDVAFIAEYPSAKAFGEMVRNEGYQEIVHHRQAAVKDSRLIRMKPGAAGRVFG